MDTDSKRPLRQTVMISCDNLTKRFGHFTVVGHVLFSVAKCVSFGFH